MRTDNVNSKDCISDGLVGPRIMKGLKNRPPFQAFLTNSFMEISIVRRHCLLCELEQREEKCIFTLFPAMSRIDHPCCGFMHVGVHTDVLVGGVLSECSLSAAEVFSHQ